MALFISKQDIVQEYSDTVAGMLATGWTIFTPTMGGSQGEEAHVDLIYKDHTIVCRVLLYKDSCSWEEGSDHKYILAVRHYVPADVYRQDEETWDSLYNGGYCTLWNDKGREVLERVFYAMPQGDPYGRDYHYTTDASVPALAKERREYKYRNRLYDTSSNPRHRDEPQPVQFNIDRLVKFVRKHGGRGYGNCRAEEIKGVRKCRRNDVVRYLIDFNGAKKQLAF